MTRRERLRKAVKASVDDLVGDFMYYDRKEDETLDRDALDEMFREGWITKAEILAWFTKALDDVQVPERHSEGEP